MTCMVGDDALQDTTRTKIDMPPMQRIKSLALPPAALSSMEFDTIMEMHWLIHLDVSGMKLGEIEISKMARNLRNMTCLNVSNTDLTTSGAVMFIRNMPRLEKLYLAGNENVSVDHIEFETLPHLRTLDVRECEIEDRGFELLLGKDTLEELSLMYDELSFEEWMKFMSKLNRFVAVGCTVEGKQGPVEGICYTNLKWLDVSGTKVTSEMMEEIVKFVLLNRLEMNNCELADETICHLGSNLKKLGHLALNENENLIDIDGVVGLEKLEHLGVNNTEIKETGLENIATLTTLTSLDVSTVADLDANMHLLAPLVRLKHLKAFNAYLTPVGAEALAQLQTLNYLDLSAGSTDYQEHEYLSDSYQWNIMPHLSRLTNLHELKMRNSAIGDRGVAYFAQMTNLEELDLNGSTGITDAGQAMLQAHPSLRKFTCAEDTYDEEN